MAVYLTRATDLQIYSQPFGSWAIGLLPAYIRYSIPPLSISAGMLYLEHHLKLPHKMKTQIFYYWSG